jgi:hypothetical protein
MRHVTSFDPTAEILVKAAAGGAWLNEVDNATEVPWRTLSTF